MPALTAEDVIAQANAMTDVTDPQPQHFRANLDAVLESMNEELEWTPAGVQSAVGRLAVALRNRMEVDRFVADTPGVEESAIERPIFLTGLPRSGTTYFQYLFDQDPALRMMRTWEGDRPCPPPATDPASVDRRRAASTEAYRASHELTGGAIEAMHLTDIDGPQECLAILDQTFVNPGLLWQMSGHDYLEFLLEKADLREVYDYHARVLKVLQWGGEQKRWALKWPCHLLALPAIAAAYPDARFVATHRDPVQALASNCSMAQLLRSSSAPGYDPKQTGRDMLEVVRRHVDGIVAFDKAQEQNRTHVLVHVDYYALVEDPASVMQPVFDAIDLEWDADVEERVRAWREANPKGKRGTHTYALEDYGLDRDQLTEAFSDYTTRFGIPSESGVRSA